eukprot:COSAG01_NODE_24_length_37608_cov_19.303154_2_plen_87_part_00
MFLCVRSRVLGGGACVAACTASQYPPPLGRPPCVSVRSVAGSQPGGVALAPQARFSQRLFQWERCSTAARKMHAGGGGGGETLMSV